MDNRLAVVVDLATACVISLLLAWVLPSLDLGDRVLIYGVAAVSLSLLWGQAGLMSFGQGIFFGGGAYAAGLVILHWHAGLIGAWAAAIAAGALLAAIIGGFSTGRSGIYFVLLTFAFAEMFSFLVYTFGSVTGGENGLLNVPRVPLELFGSMSVGYSSALGMYIVCSIVFVCCYVFIRAVSRSRFGSVLRAIRDNERRCEYIGYNTRAFKLVAFVITGAVTGLSGAVYALLLQSVPPSSMQISKSEDILVMAILGGQRIWGGAFGALVVVLLSDQLSSYWSRWQIVLGAVLIGIILLKSALGGEQSYTRWIRRLSVEKLLK